MARANAGDIVLTTGLDNSKLVKELDKLEKELYDEQIDLNIINIDYESAKRQLDLINKDLEQQKNKQEEINEKIKEQQAIIDKNRTKTENGWKITGDINEYRGAINEMAKLRSILDETFGPIDKLLDAWDKQFDIVNKIELKLQKQNNDIEDTESKIENVKNQMTEASNVDISKNMNKANSSLDKIAKSVSHLGLRLLGINSLYGMISQSVSRVQDQNPQFATFMQAIQNMLDVVISKLMSMIEPFLPRLLPMIEKVLTLIFKIAEALDKTLGPVIDAIIDAIEWIIDAFGWLIDGLLSLLGIDVSHETEQFAKDINEASKGLKNTNKEVAKLRKQLLGFDEMNVLNSETGSVGALGTVLTGGTKNYDKTIDKVSDDLQTFINDLDKFEDYNVTWGFTTPQGALTGGIGWDKYGQDLVKYWKQFNEFYDTARSISEKNGVVTIVGRTGETIQLTREELDGLIDDLNKKVISKKNLNSWLKIQKAFQDINVKRYSITQKAIAQGFKDATIEYKDGLVNVRLATGETITYTEEEFDKLKQYVYSVGVEIANDAAETGSKVEDNFWSMGEEGKDSADKAEEEWNWAFGEIEGNSDKKTKNIQGGWLGVGTAIINKSAGVSGAVTGAFTEIESSSNTNAKNTKNNWLNSIDTIIEKLNGNDKGSLVNTAIDVFNTIANYPPSEKEKKNMFSGIQSAIDNLNKNPLKVKIQAFLETTGMMKTIKQLSNVSGWLGSPWKKLYEQLLKLGYHEAKGGIHYFAKGGLVNLPKLASGGLINRPGKGVPLAVGGVAGERGREAILPLTDTQQMQYLGREIAKHVIINLTNVTELDGRQIAIATAKVMNDMQFQSNGGVI